MSKRARKWDGLLGFGGILSWTHASDQVNLVFIDLIRT
jgi:hypothetical protein